MPDDLAVSPDLLNWQPPTAPAIPPPASPTPPWAAPGLSGEQAVASLNGTAPPIAIAGVPGLPQTLAAAATPKAMQGSGGGGARMSWEAAAPLIAGTESNDRNVPNYRYDAGHTASGHYQITDTNWRAYGPRVGVDVSQYPTAMSAPKGIQEAVAKLMYQEQGFAPWAPYNPKLAAAIGWNGQRMSGRFGGMGPRSGSSLLGAGGTSAPAATQDVVQPQQSALSRALGGSPVNLQLAPSSPQTPVAAAPAMSSPITPLQPVPLPPAPNLIRGYQDALASILNGQRRGMGSIFG